MSDKLADGRSFRILPVMDQFTRECICLNADRAMTGGQVAQALERAKPRTHVGISTVNGGTSEWLVGGHPDAAIAYTIPRISFGMNFMLHGVSRLLADSHCPCWSF
jgi:transposase InsO family protein